MMRQPYFPSRQNGAAVLTALLIVALAVSIVSGILWKQNVSIRNTENLRLSQQIDWLRISGLDWARLLLRDDKRRTIIDHLGETWATPMAETQLDTFLGETAHNASNSVLSGRIEDAQGRFNLLNILDCQIQNNKIIKVHGINPSGLHILERLLQQHGLHPNTAQTLAEKLRGSLELRPPLYLPLQTPWLYTDDSAEWLPNNAFSMIEPFIVLLPTPTPININTAPLEVLRAAFEDLSLNMAQQWLLQRQTTPALNLREWQKQFLTDSNQNKHDKNDDGFKNKPSQHENNSPLFSVESDYFLVWSLIRHGHAEQAHVSLISRQTPDNPLQAMTQIIWTRDLDDIPNALKNTYSSTQNLR
jgi:general secretion pathway protein K